MRTLLLNSHMHFEVREEGGNIVLVSYPDDCPLMGDRGPYTPEEGTVVESWPKGEVVCFRDSVMSSFTVTADITGLVKEGEIWCGDDFWYGLRKLEKETSS